MTSVLNRRAALGLLGAGSAAFLAACAPLRSVKKGAESPSESASESPASTASASPTEQKKDYSGEARLESTIPPQVPTSLVQVNILPGICQNPLNLTI